MEIKINVKPLSDNKLWMGRHVKTKDYTKYEKVILSLLPDEELEPKKTKIDFEFWFSNRRSDATNPLKALCDILWKKYTQRDDRFIYEARIVKKIVKKWEEYIKIVLSYLE